VEEGINSDSPWNRLQGQILLGDETFIERCRELLQGKDQIKEIPGIQRYLSRPGLADILAGGIRKGI